MHTHRSAYPQRIAVTITRAYDLATAPQQKTKKSGTEITAGVLEKKGYELALINGPPFYSLLSLRIDTLL